MTTRHPLHIRSGSLALVDPALLPEDVVERLAVAQAIVVAEAHPGEATVLLGAQDGALWGLERPEGSPRPALGVITRQAALVARERARATFRGALAGAIAAAPVAATLVSKGLVA